MIKCIEVAKKISKQLDKDCIQLLEENNLRLIFWKIYNSPAFAEQPIEVKNTIIIYIIYAYDNNSQWININADRMWDKENILRGIGGSSDVYPYNEILHNKNSEINDIILDYVTSITNWKWRTIMAFLDIHQQALKAITEPITTTDDAEIQKLRKQRTDSLKEAMRNRAEIVDAMLEDMKREYVKTDRATQVDFGFETTNEATIDPMSWKAFIKDRNEKMAK